MGTIGFSGYAHALADLLLPRERSREYIGAWRDGVGRWYSQQVEEQQFAESCGITAETLCGIGEDGVSPWPVFTSAAICYSAHASGGPSAFCRMRAVTSGSVPDRYFFLRGQEGPMVGAHGVYSSFSNCAAK